MDALDKFRICGQAHECAKPHINSLSQIRRRIRIWDKPGNKNIVYIISFWFTK